MCLLLSTIKWLSRVFTNTFFLNTTDQLTNYQIIENTEMSKIYPLSFGTLLLLALLFWSTREFKPVLTTLPTSGTTSYTKRPIRECSLDQAGTLIHNSFGVKSATLCAMQCDMFAQCTLFNWNENGEGGCYLYNVNITWPTSWKNEHLPSCNRTMKLTWIKKGM